jgi:hypothetical protein
VYGVGNRVHGSGVHGLGEGFGFRFQSIPVSGH